MALDVATLINPGNKYHLQEISKDLQGEVWVVTRTDKTCVSPPSVSWLLVQGLHLVQSPAQCDTNLGRTLTGAIDVSNLTTIFTGQQAILRGVHAADFSWTPTTGGFIGPGTLQGITNAGIVRPPAAQQECEPCRQPGILTGHLFAHGQTLDTPFFYVDAVYRLAWDPIADPQSRATVRGTLEGVIIVPCQ